MVKSMVEGIVFVAIIVFMMAIGRMIKVKEKESFYIVMAIYMWGNLQMTKLMVLEIVIIQMDNVIEEHGLMTNKMDLE